MHDDDVTFGRLLTRRKLFVMTGAACLTGGLPLPALSNIVSSSCIARPQQTQGPYFVDTELNRTDIRVDPTNGKLKEGTPLEVAFHVSRLAGGKCTPLKARVDLWHCDALGLYSGVSGPGFDTAGEKFLRGYQLTGDDGFARFVSIYPGWYPGRAVHMHIKIRAGSESAGGLEFTSQVYFDDDLTDRVHAGEPYPAKRASRPRNVEDGIFRRGGARLMLAPEPSAGGYAASFAIALQTD